MKTLIKTGGRHRQATQRVAHAAAELAAGRLAVVTDGLGEGDLAFAADRATTSLVSFVIRYTSGYLSVAMDGESCSRLRLPPMWQDENSSTDTLPLTVTVDAKDGISTGISAADRAHTIRLLGDPTSVFDQFTRPGHVVPIRVDEGGVLVQPRKPEAAVELARLAGLGSAVAVSGIVSESTPTEMATGGELAEFATRHGIALVSVADILIVRQNSERVSSGFRAVSMAARHGDFLVNRYRSAMRSADHLVLLRSQVAEASHETTPPLVSVHRECALGAIFGPALCGCRNRLESALDYVAATDNGVVIYLRGEQAHSGARQSQRRAMAEAAEIIVALGHGSVRLLADDPSDATLLAERGVHVAEVLRTDGRTAVA